jgi:radical SAM-linked protein
VRGTAGHPVRLRYTKRGKVRWISHRDVARALERAFRIAALPLAFTEGFSPRPKVSFGLALSTGYESEAEYVDLELTREVDLSRVAAALSAALPDGIDVTGAVPLEDRAPALQDAVTAVEWHVDVAYADGSPIAAPELDAHVRRALTLPALPTSRRRKGREVEEDVAPVIRRCELRGSEHERETVSLEMELTTLTRSAKPDDVLAGIARATDLPGGLVGTRVLRTRQWIERDGTRCEPLDADTRPRVLEARAS